MLILLYRNFTKRINSLDTPAEDNYEGDPAILEIALKDGASVLNPVVKLNYNGSIVGLNYAYIPDLGRYYYVRDWEAVANKIWNVHLSVDALATYGDKIKASKQFVLRAESKYNGEIIDTLPLTTTDIRSFYTVAPSDFYTPEADKGSYVISVIDGESSSAFGAVSYYVCTSSELNELINYLLNNVDWSSITDISAELAKQLINPLQYITSCRFFPFTVPKNAGTFQNLKIGSIETGKAVGIPRSYEFSYTCTIPITKHPQAADGVYLNVSPYTSYVLEFEPFGMIPLDTTLLAECENLTCSLEIDIFTGESSLSIYNTNTVIAKRYANIGVNVPLAQISTDVLGVATSVISGASGAVTSAISGNVGGAISSVASGIMGAVQSAFPQCEAKGSGGARAFLNRPVLYSQHYITKPIKAEFFGKPLFECVQLGTLSGYVQCAKPQISIPATREEQDEVVRQLETGVFV